MAQLLDWRFLLLFIAINAVSSKRIKDMIYMPVDGVTACFRRHNGSHQFGCSSPRAGSVGVIQLVDSDSDIKWLQENATAGPYAAVLPFSMFTRDVLIRLRNTNNVNGILLTRNTTIERPSHYSPADTCPNRYSGYKQCDNEKPWNPVGSSLLLEDWPFPIFYLLNDTQLEDIKKCYWTHNAHDLEGQSKRSLCALELKAFMFAAVDSEACIRRSNPRLTFNPSQFCDPLGDRNIHWAVAPITDDLESVILVTAKLDSSSLFNDLSPGAGGAVTGFVTLLATAYYLNTLNATINKTNVVFSLLNGEDFDYIGSSRFVYDLKGGNFNSLGGKTLLFDQISSVIELSQLGRGPLYLHASNYEDNQILTQLQAALSATILKDSVPPASVQSFLKANSNLSATVISNYKEEFIYRYYQGILDDGESIGYKRNDSSTLASHLAKVAINLGNILYQNITSSPPRSTDEIIVEELIAEILTCYLDSAKCDLFRAASAPGVKLPSNTLPLYVGVNRSPVPAVSLTWQLFALLTGEKLPQLNSTVCHDKRLAWMAGINFTGICISSSVNYSMAVSPAFIIEGYDMKSGVYSTWTESVWQYLSVRMFLKPSAAVERLSMIVGCVVASISFVVVWFINSRADILFGTSGNVDC
ncbi:nicastrin isoform X2 [Cephus cinctus]|uniref:Nicastrin n=1 Tax=Cephus cinctus TaxID=211228 RepID=A0AAJ7FFA0_CEPCN|nr:nicastrin isoform X2 [Cephus cinctus]